MADIEPAAWEYDHPSPTGTGREVNLVPPWLHDTDGRLNARPLYRSPTLTDAEREAIEAAIRTVDWQAQRNTHAATLRGLLARCAIGSVERDNK